jgi:hypothetical protein
VQKLQGAERSVKVRKELTMRHVLTAVAMAAFWCSLVSLGLAEDTKATQSPDAKKVEAKANATANAKLRASIHRTMADLIEARSAEKPDQAKIDSLSKKVQQLREKFQAQAPAVVGNVPAGWVCPWGGPGMGFGRGAAWGGPGRGQGAGRGPGGGPGAGRGFGPGTGLGLGAGGGAFVDEDNDGICDYYEVRHGMHK